MSELLSLLSHELRTPLAALLLHVELLRAAEGDDAQRAKLLEAVERSARAQARMIEDLLDASRIAAGRLELERRSVDLAALAREAVDGARDAADKQAVTVETVLDRQAGRLVGDPGRLRHAMWHLVANAIKFTRKGGRVTVALERDRDGARAVFRVRDTGIGIAAGDLERIFQPFAQAERTARYGGLGLGLAIARHVAERHGGSLVAHSEGEDRGATFTMALPVAGGSRARPADEGREAQPLRGVKVLVVEDHDETRDATVQVLRETGAVVRGAPSAAEARTLVEQFGPDLLVCDIVLPPGEDGYSVVRWLRAHGPAGVRDIPAVALTGLGSDTDRRRAREAGFDLHLSKPLNGGQLRDALCELIGRRGP